jgi:Ca2+-binding RTX toxin-like protein
MWGDDENTHSTFDNNGTITASGGAIVLNGEEQFRLVNTGNITSTLSDLAFYAAASHKSSDITNSGQIVGDIIFGRGADVYDGRGGTIKGLVAGEAGEDVLTGGDHRDHFNGGHGHDILTGGKGADVFSYNFASDSTNGRFGHDVITDFSHAQSDRLDLHIIDAIDGGTDDAFTFIGRDAFDGHAGQLHFGFHGGNTLVAGDTDGDGHADFTIELQGHIDLVQGDFHL